ncbi:hypothetical protein BSKO_10491 [Bryopsis sp. KO-2023]|nr:hypothetical protein BSKO_10491 [Bryopsis sp. KO-2023]
MATKYGVFSEPTYISLGDPYIKKEKKGDPDVAQNLKASKRKTGKGNDALFGRFQPLYEGEKFVDTHKLKMTQLAEKRKGGASESQWKAASPMKKSTGAGDFYGTLGGKIPASSEPPRQGWKKGDYQQGPPNMHTNPSPKGTYGCTKLTLSERVGHKGVAGEYEYVNEPFGEELLAQRRHERQKREQNITEAPFKPANPPKRGLAGFPGRLVGGKGLGVSGEFRYVPLGEAARQRIKPPDVPFRYSGPPKKGCCPTFGRFPEHVPDPETLKMQAARDLSKMEREKLAGHNPWRPTIKKRVDCVRSILSMNA